MTPSEETVSKFASLLGTESLKGGSTTTASSLTKTDPVADASRELMNCLSKGVAHHEVICTIPSLDMRNPDDDSNGAVSLLPKVGEHFSSETTAHQVQQKPQTTTSTTSTSSSPPSDPTSSPTPATTTSSDMPQMEASVLSNAADASARAAQVEQRAAQSLGSLTSWTKSSVVYAPGAISKNVADSFSSLVDSRVRAWTLLLLRHSLTTGDSSSRSRLLSMLSSIIKVDSAKTAFKTLPLPESAAGQTKEADVILPLLLEVDLQVAIQDKEDKVTLRAPGTIAANFDFNPDGTKGSGLKSADIRLDTGALLDSMVQQARLVVFKAVAKATSATDSTQLDTKSEHKTDLISSPLSGFSSALSLSTTTSSTSTSTSGFPSGSSGSSVAPGPNQPAHRLAKAKSSALKLGSILETTSDTTAHSGNASFDHRYKKTRSVQWDASAEFTKAKTAVDLPSPNKRQKMVTTARLTSFKSFGRPHAGDFGSGPKNATFGDFGRGPIWGRDGKLANKPTPMNPTETRDILTSQTRKTANATFDVFQKPPIHLSSGMDLGIGKRAGISTKDRRKSGSSNMNRVPSSIPRTATALEGWLVDQTKAMM